MPSRTPLQVSFAGEPPEAEDSASGSSHPRNVTGEAQEHLADLTENRRDLGHAQGADQAYRRYRDHLASALRTAGYPDSDTLASVALDALITWRDVDTGALCRCSCHLRLPASGLHDYGLNCTCSETAEERRGRKADLHGRLKAIAQSLEGQRIASERHAAEADLQNWLADHPEVVVSSRGGLAPEEWHGSVDGRTFYFRERHGEWSIDIDGETIARGLADIDGYGSNPVERVQFIVEAIRTHFARLSCTLHGSGLTTIEKQLGCAVRWCPLCGARVERG